MTQNPSSSNQSRPKFQPTSAFKQELNSRVDAYFQNKSRSGGFQMLFLTSLFLVMFFSSYLSSNFLMNNLYLKLGLFVISGLVFGILGIYVHEASHNCLTRWKFFNNSLLNFARIMGFDVDYYRFRHTLHHNYTNIEGVDGDIDFGSVIRTTTSQDRKWYHRFQAAYVNFLYLFVTGLFLIWEPKAITEKSKAGINRKEFKTKELYVNYVIKWTLYKSCHLLILLVIPVMAGGIWLGLAHYFITMSVFGFWLAINIQPSHTFQESFILENKRTDTDIEANKEKAISNITTLEEDFYTHILKTTSNFSPKSAFIRVISGGMNLHLAHSLFPGISQQYSRDINKIIKEVAASSGLQVREFDNLPSLYLSHLKFLNQAGR